MATKKQLTEAEFDEIRPLLSRFKDNNIHILHEILVEGKKQIDVAKTRGITNKTISAMMNRAWALHLEHGSRPKGWVKVTLTLPKELATLMKYLEDKVHADYKKGSL